MEIQSHSLDAMENSEYENHDPIPGSPNDHAQQDSSTFFDDAMEMLPNNDQLSSLVDEPSFPLYPLSHYGKHLEAADPDPLFQYIDWENDFDAPTCDLESSPCSSVCRPFTRTPSISSVASFGSMDSGGSSPLEKSKKRKRLTDVAYSQPVENPRGENATKKACHEADTTISTEPINPGNETGKVIQGPSEVMPLASEQHSENRTAILACPWYRRFPLRHGNCSGYHLSLIKDVLQHIQHDHVRNQESPSSRADESSCSVELCDDQAKSQTCESRSTEKTNKVDGICVETFKLLVHDRAKPIEESWYDFWDIIFEGTPRPASPFLGTFTEESVGTALAYWKQEADDVIPVVLHDQQQIEAGQLPGLVSKILFELQSRASKLGDTSHETLAGR